MYKIAVIGDYGSIYGFATLGLSICPVKTREEAKNKLKQLAEGKYGIIYITELWLPRSKKKSKNIRSRQLPAIIQIRVCRATQAQERRRQKDCGAGGRFRYSVFTGIRKVGNSSNEHRRN